jgi:hypothetical protein
MRPKGRSSQDTVAMRHGALDNSGGVVLSLEGKTDFRISEFGREPIAGFNREASGMPR